MTSIYDYRPPVIGVWDRKAGEYRFIFGSDDERVCAAQWASAGGDHATGDICGRPAEQEIGDLDACDHHYKRAGEWAAEQCTRERQSAEQARAAANLAQAELEAERRKLSRARAVIAALVDAEVEARLAELAREQEGQAREQEERRCREREEASIVYYVRRERDGLIKIGTTGFPRRRMAALRSQYGPLQVLYCSRGGPAYEAAEHRRYADWLAEGREWFHPGAPLLRHLAFLRRATATDYQLPGSIALSEIEALAAKALKEPPPWRHGRPGRLESAS
jgi:hypothetical protein